MPIEFFNKLFKISFSLFSDIYKADIRTFRIFNPVLIQSFGKCQEESDTWIF